MALVLIFIGFIFFTNGIKNTFKSAKDRAIETLESLNKRLLEELKEKQNLIFKINTIILENKTKTPE